MRKYQNEQKKTRKFTGLIAESFKITNKRLKWTTAVRLAMSRTV